MSLEKSLHAAVLDNNNSLCKQLIEKNKNVDIRNDQDETALHISTGSKVSTDIVLTLLKGGCSVNSRNRWHQTPLHYAASERSLEKMDIMLKCGDVLVDQKDLKGYTALHSFVHSTEDVCKTWQEGLRLLLHAGADINSQTNFGYTVLHLACNKFNNIALLESLLASSPDVTLVNEDKENFLHSFVIRGLDEEANVFLKGLLENEFQACPREKLIELFNQRDVYGQTPLYMCLDSQELTIDTFCRIIKYGANVNIYDNLGNSSLLRVVALSLGNCADVVKCLCRAGVDINASNYHGQTVVHMVKDSRVLDILLKERIDLNTTDRWNRGPLTYALKFPKTQLLPLMVEHGAHMEQRDLFGATPLHYASFHNNAEGVKYLIDKGVDANVKDSEGKTPLDIAKLYGNKESVEILQACTVPSEILLYERDNAWNVIKHFPSAIRHEHLNEIETILPLPSNPKAFADSVLRTNGLGRVGAITESEEIQKQVKLLVEHMCQKVTKYDSLFEITVFPTGSSGEGTKVGYPDEFDFAICLNRIADICDISQPSDSHQTGFACLKHVSGDIPVDFIEFFDESGYFIAWSVLQHLFRLLRRALNEKNTNENGNLCYKFENDLRHLTSKPVFNITLIWTGTYYKHISISVDIVPAVRKTGWWPGEVDSNGLRLMTDDVKAAGCLILLQAQGSGHEDLIICGINDSINVVRESNGTDDRKGNFKRSFLRISTAPAEMCVMRSFPQVVKDSYMLAKVLKTKKICPKLIVRRISQAAQYHLLGIQRKNLADRDDIFKPDRYISSYMLKNCVFHVLSSMGWRPESDPKEFDLVDLTVKIFHKLQTFNGECLLPPYFLSFMDIFMFEDTDIMPESLETILALSLSKRSRISDILKIILAILGNKIA